MKKFTIIFYAQLLIASIIIGSVLSIFESFGMPPYILHLLLIIMVVVTFIVLFIKRAIKQVEFELKQEQEFQVGKVNQYEFQPEFKESKAFSGSKNSASFNYAFFETNSLSESVTLSPQHNIPLQNINLTMA